MDEATLEKVYLENLEERVIACLAAQAGMPLETAMDVYYHSRLAGRIERGDEGIQYLDHQVLVDILCQTENELLQSAAHGNAQP